MQATTRHTLTISLCTAALCAAALPLALAAQPQSSTDSNGQQQMNDADRNAMSQQSPPSADQAPASPTFQSLDTNNDGRISRAEAGADTSLGSNFSGLDVDHDGYVSNVEYAALPQDSASGATAGTAVGGTSSGASTTSGTYRSSGFKALDTDGDGRISSNEAAMDASFNSRFGTLDANGDGYVSKSEYQASGTPSKP